MNPIPPPDCHYLDAAQGWIMLENIPEARLEFAQISPAHRTHLDYLDTEWRLLTAELRWEASLRPAQLSVELYPKYASGWIHRSYSLHELKRTAEAWDQLLPAASSFPKEPTIPYNLACYACQLGRMERARSLLKVAVEMESDAAGKRTRLEMAVTDPDLKPLWDEIQKQMGKG